MKEPNNIRITLYNSQYRIYLNGQEIGSVDRYPSRSIKNAVELWGFCIYTKHQDQGYGQQLLQEVIRRNQKKRAIILYVYKRDARAIHIYEKLGFSIAGEYLDGGAWEMRIYPRKEKSY